jgi:hypothetical protein
MKYEQKTFTLPITNQNITALEYGLRVGKIA